MVKVIIAKPILSDREISLLEGEYFDSTHFPHIIRSDTDVYIYKNGEKQLLLRFRKNVISKKLTDLAIESYRSQAKIKHANRGAAAGIIDIAKLPKYVRDSELYHTSKFRTSYIDKTGKPSKLNVANEASSNIGGYFDSTTRSAVTKSARSTVPCRLTSFSSKHRNLWESGLPFLIRCDELFPKFITEST